MKRQWFFIPLCALLAACSSSNLAPVTNGWHNTRDASATYRVQPEDTLYSIAFRYGLDYRELATLNHLSPPYSLITGQQLVLSPHASDLTLAATTTPTPPVTTGGAPLTPLSSQPVTNAPAVTTPVSVSPPLAAETVNVASAATSTTPPLPAGKTGWQWPVRGQVIQTFSTAYGGNKGIDIAGTLGQTVHATAAGRVVYCGSGLRGYGLLIIIKHNDEFISAYAHNSKALVKEGQQVVAGQAIALMGSTDASRVLLHFEIRKAGKPVNPLDYLPPLQG